MSALYQERGLRLLRITGLERQGLVRDRAKQNLVVHGCLSRAGWSMVIPLAIRMMIEI